MKRMPPWLVAGCALLFAAAAPVVARVERPVSSRALPDMPSPRAAHSASLLRDGSVLLAGGCHAQGCEEGISDDAVLFDPATASFASAGKLAQARAGHRAVPLRDGSILLFGGWTPDGATASVERYDPESHRFSVHGRLLHARDGFSATALHDGTVLVAGGYAGAMQRSASAELYDPRSGRSIAVADMGAPRMSHTATLLADGRVLLVGGSSERGRLLDSIEIYDPATRRFSPAGSLRKARHKHAAIRVGEGVLVIGGAGTREYESQYADTELWREGEPRTSPGPGMADGRYKFLDSVVALGDGTALVAGSGRSPERLSTTAMRFDPVRVDLGAKLSFTTATRLSDGRILLAGGYDPRLQVSRKAWLLQP
ncbi:MAG: kelch repeat-containing protein [Thermomonas sp.]